MQGSLVLVRSLAPGKSLVLLGMMLGCTQALRISTPMRCGRRTLLAATAAVATPLKSALAYDTVPQQDADFAAMEKARLERAARGQKNRQRIKPLVDAITAATDQQTFASASDKLSVWLIGEGKLPEGIDAVIVRDTIVDAYKALPQKSYYCEMTRTNQGICYSPGPIADDSYTAVLRELRKCATRKGKGSLMSDGVSAANSAAF